MNHNRRRKILAFESYSAIYNFNMNTIKPRYHKLNYINPLSYKGKKHGKLDTNDSNPTRLHEKIKNWVLYRYVHLYFENKHSFPFLGLVRYDTNNFYSLREWQLVNFRYLLVPNEIVLMLILSEQSSQVIYNLLRY